MENRPVPIAVLISGRGSNLRAIVEAIRDGRLRARIAVVISNRRDAPGLEIARAAGIETLVMPHRDHASREAYDRALVAELNARQVKLVCLAGFMRMLGPSFCVAFPNAVLNIHPSLLPAFPGVDAQSQAFEHGVKVSGVTVHFVTPELDAGPIVMQTSVPVQDDDSAESLAARILAAEHRLYPAAIARVLEGRWWIAGRRVVFAAGLLIMLMVLAGACAQSPAAMPRVIDLGHPLTATDPTWSGTPVFSHTPVATFEKDTLYSAKFASDEHFGTHVDAPAHFAASGLTVDRIPADRLVRPGVCIAVAAQVAKDEDYRVTVEDLSAFERAHGQIPEGGIVFVATGWDARWRDATRYMNERDGKKHFPGLSVEATAYLARDRRVAAIGIDTPSIDYGPSAQFEAHRISSPLDVYHIENATGLTSLPPTGFTVVVAPVKIAGGSGAPARVFALVRGSE